MIVPGSIGTTSITNSLFGSSNDVSCVISPLYVPRVSSFYISALSLFKQGYRGPGMEVFDSGKFSCVNVYLPELVPAVLQSTNTVYAQILFLLFLLFLLVLTILIVLSLPLLIFFLPLLVLLLFCSRGLLIRLLIFVLVFLKI